MKDAELLQTFVNFLPFLADVLGKDTEILIHDLNKGDHSLIAIENNISSRKIGRVLLIGQEKLLKMA